MLSPTFDHIRPPSDALKINHPDNDKKHGQNERLIRRIFYLDNYLPFEEEKIEAFNALLAKQNLVLPDWWRKEESLRWIHAGRFDLQKTLNMVKTHLKFLEEADKGLSPGGERILRGGTIYQFGRDRHLRPIVVVDLAKLVRENLPIDDFTNALVFLLQTVKKTMFLPGHVEEWVVIQETIDLSLFKLPQKHIKTISEVTQTNFPCYLCKMFMLNPPFIVRVSWNMLKGFFDPMTAEKIDMLNGSTLNEIQTLVDPENLEKRFGGSHPNLEVFWPPQLPKRQNKVSVVANNGQFDVNFNPRNYIVKEFQQTGPEQWIEVEKPMIKLQEETFIPSTKPVESILKPVPITLDPIPLQQEQRRATEPNQGVEDKRENGLNINVGPSRDIDVNTNKQSFYSFNPCLLYTSPSPRDS
eukprot:TRINITY_DN4565_c0_g1_i6.p1 TRINITY_DN4565_c0_g1~~TRINITY_DN4565_c0_g1_i6.p1  ORF type:complete len:412 (+),score=92.29 TRINITY_DN4565_c0_g1_i6:55-1290(+)